MYVQSYQHNLKNKTQFITNRFGNVLGSNGSVIPCFRKQIAKGDRLRLVLQAGTMGEGGDKTKTLPTHNEKIMVAKDDYLPFPTVYSKTRQLVTSAVRAKSNKEMVGLLKDLVPEFISKNSKYEELDKPVPPRTKKGKIHAS